MAWRTGLWIEIFKGSLKPLKKAMWNATRAADWAIKQNERRRQREGKGQLAAAKPGKVSAVKDENRMFLQSSPTAHSVLARRDQQCCSTILDA